MGESRTSKYYARNPRAAEKRRAQQSRYQSSEKEKKKRAARNAARRKAIANGQARKGDNKDVHHKDGNPLNNRSSNLKVISRSANRAKK